MSYSFKIFQKFLPYSYYEIFEFPTKSKEPLGSI